MLFAVSVGDLVHFCSRRRSLLAALTYMLFPGSRSVRDATGGEGLITALAVDVWARGLPGQRELYWVSWEKRTTGDGQIQVESKRLREEKDCGYLGRALQTSLQKHLSIRNSELVWSHSVTVFHLCCQRCAQNNVGASTEFPDWGCPVEHHQLTLPVQQQQWRRRWNWEELAPPLSSDRYFSIQNS